MKPILKLLFYIILVGVVVFVHSLFFIHHPPEVQLAFLTPGVTLLVYSIIRDDLYKKPSLRVIRGKLPL
ncbi:MAG TPA: hypothetical protein VL490_12085 [Mucilaginibacter sp.]|nr:hypothetical protein [Mucilaginibacter sp.]